MWHRYHSGTLIVIIIIIMLISRRRESKSGFLDSVHHVDQVNHGRYMAANGCICMERDPTNKIHCISQVCP